MGKRRRTCGSLVPKDDLIGKILVRLPVKSLLRFKSVCKSWCALIQSSSFIDLHATTTTSSASSSKFGSFVLLALRDRCSPKKFHVSRQHSLIRLSDEEESGGGGGGGGWRWWTTTTGSNYDYDEQDYYNEEQMFSGGGGSNVLLKLDSLGVPSCYQSCFYMKHIVGLCNGVVCLYDRVVNKICLWNPATKLHRILPKPINVGGYYSHDRLVGFGFDVETKDYKVVLFSGFSSMRYRPASPIECLCRVQVYSLSTDSWRLLDGITCLPGNPFNRTDEGQLYLNGSCFFMAHFFHTQLLPCLPENNRFLISFDFTKEIITPIQLPDHHRDQKLFLSYLGDKIALFTKYEDCDYEEYNIWVLNLSEEEKKNNWVLKKHSSSSSSNTSVNKESWTKLHTFQIKVRDERNIPKGISDDGEFALLAIVDSTGLGKKMLLYNLATKQVEKKFLYCTALLSKANTYKPSLVSVIGGNGGRSRSRSRSRSKPSLVSVIGGNGGRSRRSSR